MLPIHEDIERLRKDIESVFSDGVYPGDDNIVSCQHAGCTECARISDLFRGKAWKEVAAGELRYSAILAGSGTMLSKEAFHYFLPTLMIASLHFFEYQDHISSGAAEIMASLEFNFTPPSDNPKWLSSWSKRMSGFNSDQRRIIVRYLEFARDSAYGFKEEDTSEADRAIEYFSSKELDES